MPAIVLLLALVAGAAWMMQTANSGALELRHGQALESPRPLGDFELLDQHEQPFTRSELEGHWSLIFIGFTYCPDVCPSTLSQLGALNDRLGAEAQRLRLVLLSVDPERDTPGELDRYLGYFSAPIIGATGVKSQIDRLCEDLEFGYVRVPLSQGRYTVDHSGALALIDPQARLAGYFMPPFDIEELASDLGPLLAARE